MNLAGLRFDRNFVLTGMSLVVIYIVIRVASGFVVPLATGIFPASAAALALLYFGGARLWPFLIVGSIGAEWMLGYDLPHILAFSAVSTAQASLGALLLRTWRIDPIFRRKKDVYILIATSAAVALATLGIVALLNAYSGIAISGVILAHAYFGAFVSHAIIVSFLLRLIVKPRFKRNRREKIELAAVFALLIITCMSIVIDNDLILLGIPVALSALAPLFWIAVRLRPRFVTLALLIVGVAAIAGAIRSGDMLDPATFLVTQLYLSVAAIAFLFITAQEEDRRASLNVMLSHLHTIENALVRVRSEAKAKEDFVAVLSHELRNPLAPVLSTIEYMKLDENRPVHDREALDLMEDRVKTLRTILEDLLEVSRIAEGKAVYEMQTIDLISAIRASILSTAHYRVERHQELIVESPLEPVLISADRVRIEQVFTNLLSNASKYSHAGGTITLRVKNEGSGVTVSISDNGTGLARESLEEIFLPFQQANTRDKHVPGLGIGLALVKNFVEHHGGVVRAESPGVGLGSTFIVKLPTASTPPLAESSFSSAHEQQPRAGAPGALVLVADDNDAAATTLGKLLEALQYRVAYAYDGYQAVEVALATNPAAVLLDLSMPRKSGADAARELRARGYKGTIVALSGYDEKDAAQIYGDIAAFDHFVVKPVGVAELRAVIPPARVS